MQIVTVLGIAGAVFVLTWVVSEWLIRRRQR
jgi:hypothetical protein